MIIGVLHSLMKKFRVHQPNGKVNVISMEPCVTTNSLVQEIPFHQKRHHHLMMKAMGLTRPAQQLEIL
jgi:hypothetical protein